MSDLQPQICTSLLRSAKHLVKVVALAGIFAFAAMSHVRADVYFVPGHEPANNGPFPDGNYYMTAQICNSGPNTVQVGGAIYLVDTTQIYNTYAQVYFSSEVVMLAPNDCHTFKVLIPMDSSGDAQCYFQGDFFTGPVITTPFSPTNGYAVQNRELGGIFDTGVDCVHGGSVSGRVWLGTCNNVDQPNAAGIGNVKVVIKDSSGNIVGVTLTANDGSFTFIHLGAGNYTVMIDTTTLPAGVHAAFDVDGTNTPNIVVLGLSANQNLTGVDFGYCRTQQSNGATRTWGFYKNHLDCMKRALSCVNLGVLQCPGGGSEDLTQPTISQIETIFWSKFNNQSSLGSARQKLAHQLIAAIANSCYVGTSTMSKGYDPNLIAKAVSALDGTDISLMGVYEGMLDGYNNSGDAIGMPAGTPEGPNDHAGSVALANPASLTCGFE